MIALARGMSEFYSPSRVYLVKLDNWFSFKWFQFAGVVLPTLGVGHIKPVRVPPFNPNRVVREQLFERRDDRWRERFDAAPLHVAQHSSDNLRRWLLRISDDSLFIWYSGGTRRNHRGSVMAHHIPHAVGASRDETVRANPGFYSEVLASEGAWRLGSTRGESRELIERWCRAAGDAAGASSATAAGAGRRSPSS